MMFYGFAPFSLLTYSISGPGSRASNTVIVSQFGTYRTFLGNDWPAGSYTITAVDGAQSVTISAVKQAVPGPSFGP